MHHLIVSIGLWFEWWTGVINTTWYNFWSGFGSDFTEWSALFGALWLAGRHLNCREKGCWRLGLHNLVDPDTGEHIRICAKHHPHHDAITAEHIANVAHRIHLRRQRAEKNS